MPAVERAAQPEPRTRPRTPAPHAGCNTRGWRDEQRAAPVIPHNFKLCFLRLWCSRRHDHWLARKIDFLVRVTRRVPEVPRFFRCRSTVRGDAGKGVAYRVVLVGIHHAPDCTPRAVSPTSRHRPSELSVATVGQATRGSTRGQLSGDLRAPCA